MNSPYGLPIDKCLDCHLRSDNFFCALSRESVADFNRIKHCVVYPERALIFVEGQAPRGIFMLCQGQAKLCTTGRDGRTLILRIAKPGEALGLNASLSGRPHEVTVETMQPCRLNFVSREDFLPFLKSHSDACMHAAQHMSRDYRDACEVIRYVGSHTIPARLAKFLLESSAEGQIADGVVRTKLTLTHEDIAQLVGTTRETITRTLAEFRRMQIIELKGATLTIRDKVALVRLVAA